MKLTEPLDSAENQNSAGDFPHSAEYFAAMMLVFAQLGHYAHVWSSKEEKNFTLPPSKDNVNTHPSPSALTK